jgi:DNA replication protein DnaC
VNFGRLEPCICKSKEIARNASQRVYELSNLNHLSHLRFDNFNSAGNRHAKFIGPQEIQSLQEALVDSEKFAKNVQSWFAGDSAAFAVADRETEKSSMWLLLEGSYGCGKTHLAAAIANETVSRGVPTLFMTIPDLLDSLRFAYNNPETTFETRFEDVRTVALLVLDDFGTQNATPWAQEKLFQIINYRYINKLPTVITTNLILDEIESRIRSRLQDSNFIKHIRITAPDYRRPTETSNPGISMLSMPAIRGMTFKNFETREDEIGKEEVTVVTVEKQDKFGNRYKDKEIVREKVTQEHITKLIKAVNATVQFAENPQGWLVLLGQSFCGKTHLAAATGNYRIALGGQAIMTEVISLLDYLKTTFRPNSDVSFDRRFYEITAAPLLILDDLKGSGASSVWAEDKLYQILSHRYNAELPTVITSTLDPDSFARNYPALWNRMLDTDQCEIHWIQVPPYRRMKKMNKPAAPKKGERR